MLFSSLVTLWVQNKVVLNCFLRQVDLQAQARAHRIGQKKDVLVIRLETVNTSIPTLDYPFGLFLY